MRVNKIGAVTPPAALWNCGFCGNADSVVPISETRKVEALLNRLGTPHEVKTYPGQGHSFRGPAQLDALTRTLRFLGKHLKKENAAVTLGNLLLTLR